MPEMNDDLLARLRVFTPDAIVDDEVLYLHWREKHAKPASWLSLFGSKAWKAWMAAAVGAVAPVVIAWMDGSIDEQTVRTALESLITATVGFIAVWSKSNAE